MFLLYILLLLLCLFCFVFLTCVELATWMRLSMLVCLTRHIAMCHEFCVVSIILL